MAGGDSGADGDLRKVRRNKLIYLVAGLGLFGVGVALVVIFIVGREVPAILMGFVAFIWGALMVNQSFRSRDLETMMEERVARRSGDATAEGHGEPAGSPAAGESPDEEEPHPGERGGNGEP